MSFTTEDFTTEDVAKLVQERGATLLSEYKHPFSELRFKCSTPGCERVGLTFLPALKHQNNKVLLCRRCERLEKKKETERQRNLASFKEPQEARELKGLKAGRLPKEVVLEKLSKMFEERGSKLVSGYEDSRSVLEFVCSNPGCGKNHKITLSGFKRGINPKLLCPQCNPYGRKGKYTTEMVSKAFKEKGVVLLSEYKGIFDPMDFVCSTPGCGNISQIKWSAFLQGSNNTLLCQSCLSELSRATVRGNRRYTHEQVAKIFAEKGATLLSNYRESTQVLEYQCSVPGCANTHFIRFSSFNAGHNNELLCTEHNPRLGKRKFFEEDVLKYFSDKGAVVLSEYKDVNTVLKYVCSVPGCDEESHITFSYIIRGGNPDLLCKTHLKLQKDSLNKKE
jgi:hypothetical protein